MKIRQRANEEIVNSFGKLGEQEEERSIFKKDVQEATQDWPWNILEP